MGQDELIYMKVILDKTRNHGIDVVRKVGEPANTLVYHLIMYKAFDDGLRIVYSQVIKQLREILLRD